MATRVALTEEIARARWQFSHFEDFYYLVDADLWTVGGDTGTGASIAEDADGVGGVINFATGATDNNEALIATSNELFKFAADVSMAFGCRVQYAEAATDDANVAFGLADAFGANLIADNGASVGINSSGALIYKLDGGTVWRANAEINSVVYDAVSVQTAGGSAYHWLEIFVNPEGPGSGNVRIDFLFDGQHLRDANQNELTTIMAVASATEMDLGFYVKAGGANSETPNVDAIYWACRRVQ